MSASLSISEIVFSQEDLRVLRNKRITVFKPTDQPMLFFSLWLMLQFLELTLKTLVIGEDKVNNHTIYVCV